MISNRLYKISEFINKGARVADIGSDHAYLPTFLVQSGKTNFVIAGEVNDGPFQSALKQINEAGLSDYVDVRKGNGLAVLQHGEVDTIVIAGMGGSLIAQILTEGIDKLEEVQQLILQPNVGSELVRKFALEHGWELRAEIIIEEDDRIYEILSFVRGDAFRPYRDQEISIALLFKMGPFLIRQKDKVFLKKWTHELSQYELIIEELLRSSHSNALQKREELLREYMQIKEIIQ